MRDFFNKVVEFFKNIPYDKLMCFIAGVLVAAFAQITLHIEWCIVPVLFVGVVKVAYTASKKYFYDWVSFAAIVIGGAVIQLFAIL